jgi:acetyl-CoA synthetase
LKSFTRERLSQHEFPRHIKFVSELPKTPAGKVNRKVLRDREAAEATHVSTSQENTNGTAR